MKKVLILPVLICASFFLLSSCDFASNSSGSVDNNPIKDGTKLKITYVVDSAYFTLPADAPKYHIYGTDTQLPVPEEKNLLGSLMKAKFWSDGTREDITVLGARDYTKEIRVEYKYSFDTEKCADGYVMIDGACVAAPNGEMIGEACDAVGAEIIIDNGRIECGTDRKWQFTGCNDGYNYVNGKCEKANPQCGDGYVLNSSGECEAIPACTTAARRCSMDGRVQICADGQWEEIACAENEICSEGLCIGR